VGFLGGFFWMGFFIANPMPADELLGNSDRRSEGPAAKGGGGVGHTVDCGERLLERSGGSGDHI
jgi:hypothetical protein